MAELEGLAYSNVKVSQSYRNVLRGMHYEIESTRQAKIIRVCSGSIVEVALDLRTGDLYEATLRADSSASFYVPDGFAHGYRVLSEEATVVYLCTNRYLPEFACAYSPLISHFRTFDWGGGTGEFKLSEKDRNADSYRFPETARHLRLSSGNWQVVA